MESSSFGSRVGAAAFAVGLGLAVATSPGTAAADEPDSPSSSHETKSSHETESSASPGPHSGLESTSSATESDTEDTDTDTDTDEGDIDGPPDAENADALSDAESVSDEEVAEPDPATTLDEPASEVELAEPGSAESDASDSPFGSEDPPVSDTTPGHTNEGAGDSDAPAGALPSEEGRIRKDADDAAPGTVLDVADLEDSADSTPAPEATSTGSAQVAASAASEQQVPARSALQSAAVETKPVGFLSGLLAALGVTPSATGTDGPMAPSTFITAVLDVIRREMNRLFKNQAPIGASVTVQDSGQGEVTGLIGASDPEGDPLKYKVTNAPTKGTVTVDAAGKFIYTPSAELAASGGTDEFVVQVRDAGFRLNVWSPRTTAVPVTVAVEAPAWPGALAAATNSVSQSADNSRSQTSGTAAVAAAMAAAVTGGTTTAIGWNWGTNAVLNFDPAKDTLDFGWMQPSNFDVTETSGSTRIEIVNNNQSYTLNGVGLGEMTMANIVARDANTVATWQNLISGANQPAPQLPSISIADLSVSEGNGSHGHFMFVATMSKTSTETVTVAYSTSDGTATAGSDYVAASGTITFAPGVTSQMVHVDIIGDAVVEQNETLTVTLSNPAGATLADATAVGTIVNDDTADPGPDPDPQPGDGTIYQVSTSGPDITDFDPARDKLNLGDVSVHNFIVVDTPEGVGFMSPWSGETMIVTGVSLGQLTVDSFTPILNDHLRQDLSGALAWEQGITPAADTVYVRSHEVGQIDRVAFNPVTGVVDFRYFGTREQLSMVDSPDGVVISNAGTGQALVLLGVTKSQLSAQNFVFHFAQVREDRLNEQLGIGPVADSQVLPQGVPIAGTNNWPTGAGNGTPPDGQTEGTTTTISWLYGTDTVLNFNPASDKLNFGWFQPDNFEVTEQSGSTRIEIVDNNQTYTLNGVAIHELSTTNIVALDDGTRSKWQTIIVNAVPTTTAPKLSVSDGSVVEGNTGSSQLPFTVTLSKSSDEQVSVGYTTSNGTATAAGSDYLPAVGTLIFAPGETSKVVQITVNGDALVELDEYFTLNLSSPVNATIADGTGTGTIVNDDVDSEPTTLPTVSIADLSVTEGNGEHSHFMFMATLSKASTETVTVGYATSDGTAIAGSDYTATTGTITFTPGVTSQMVHVDIMGDAVVEQDETFTVTLSNPLGATIADATALGTIVNDDVADPGPGGGDPTGGGGINSGNPGDELWGEQHFAPYVDMAGWPPPDLIKIAQDRGVSLLTLGFLQATSDGQAAWGGYSTLTPGSADSQAQTIDASIAAFKAAGGDVMVSFGGASGTELAQWHVQQGLGAQELADAYAGVVDIYGLNRVDFDIEGHAVAEPASIALRSAAIALLQQQRPDLEVWYTLPVLPSGLTTDGVNVVAKALEAGVKLDGVNVMAMNYGAANAPQSGPNAKTMGAYAIQAAESTHAQMSALFAQHGQEFGWNQLGVTPMIGVNDMVTEVFTVADAQEFEDFARTVGLGMLSMWSVTRDNPGSLGQASATASGTNTPAGSFSNIWNDYGTVNSMDLGSTPGGGGGNDGGNGGGGNPGGGGPVTGGTTTVISWQWGTNTVLNFDPAKDKLDFGWFQPGNFDVTETSGSTRISIVNNNQTYTLDGVGLNELGIGNIVALDANTAAKWQTLINGASV